MSFPVTAQQIKDHRAARKTSGMVGCISNKPEPPLDFFGYKDVQSWRPIDPMKPYCFCFDCRDLWDNDATIDLQLLENGNTAALWTYGELFPPEFVHPKQTLPQRSNGGGISEEPVPSLAKPTPGGGIPLPLRVDTSQPRYGSFDEVPSSLLAPRHRDLLNETKQQRLKGDLAILRGELQSELVTVMDSRRSLAYHEDPYDRIVVECQIGAKENALSAKIQAIDLLLKD
jgi:hypothetical protein